MATKKLFPGDLQNFNKPDEDSRTTPEVLDTLRSNIQRAVRLEHDDIDGVPIGAKQLLKTPGNNIQVTERTAGGLDTVIFDSGPLSTRVSPDQLKEALLKKFLL